MIEELREVILTIDVPEQGLRAGDHGMTLMAHKDGRRYTVECWLANGETTTIVTLYADEIRPAHPSEMERARSRG